MVPAVSQARRGSTSMDTRPSTPLVAAATGANRSQASAHVGGGDLEDGLLDGGAGGGLGGDDGVVVVAVGDGGVEDATGWW